MKRLFSIPALMLLLIATTGLAQVTPASPSGLPAGAFPSNGGASPTLYIYTFAGTGNQASSGDGGLATLAELDGPAGEAFDAAGNLYIADFRGNRIRRIDAVTGTITTVAGNGAAGYNGDAIPATTAELNAPFSVAFDKVGNLYIADSGNERIRKVDLSTGIIATVAGSGALGTSGDGGQAIDAAFHTPYAVRLDSTGNIYIVDEYSYRIRKVTAATGIVTTVAGNGTAGYDGDGSLAIDAELNIPAGLALDAAGNLYIADGENNRIRKVDATTGIITTFAGNGSQGSTGDGGPAIGAELWNPTELFFDRQGNLYIADTGNYLIRRIDASTGNISSVAGDSLIGYMGDGVPATTTNLYFPNGIVLDAGGFLYIGDSNNARIRIVRPQSVLSTTTALAASADTLTVGQSLTLTATVTPSSGSTPAGAVTFLNGTVSLGSVALNASGVAMLKWTPIAATYSITARYGGNSTDAASSSSSPISVTVDKIATTTALKSSASAVAAGSPLTLTASVDAASGSVPSGSVTFFNKGTSIGTQYLDASGVATLTISPSLGSYSFTATYQGTATDASSTSAPPVQVTAGSTSTTTKLTASATSLDYGQIVELTATVKAASGPTPVGTVTFWNQGTSFGTVSVGTNGTANLKLALKAATYHFYATFNGSPGDLSSTSSPLLIVVVGADPTKTVLTSSRNPSPYGTLIHFTAVVSDGAKYPTGEVFFRDGTRVLATPVLSSGRVTFVTHNLTVGRHIITADFAGDQEFRASNSNVIDEVIDPPAFTVVASPNTRVVYTGQIAIYTVTIQPGLGFHEALELGCADLPAATTCHFTPARLSPGILTSTLRVITHSPDGSAKTAAAPGLGFGALLGAASLFLLSWRFRRGHQYWQIFLFIVATGVLTVGAISGCGGSSSLNGGTPAGSHTISVTATAAFGNQTITHSAPVKLEVKTLF